MNTSMTMHHSETYLGSKCNETGKHEFPLDGQPGRGCQEKPGVYTCGACGSVKTVHGLKKTAVQRAEGWVAKAIRLSAPADASRAAKVRADQLRECARELLADLDTGELP